MHTPNNKFVVVFLLVSLVLFPAFPQKANALTPAQINDRSNWIYVPGLVQEYDGSFSVGAPTLKNKITGETVATDWIYHAATSETYSDWGGSPAIAEHWSSLSRGTPGGGSGDIEIPANPFKVNGELYSDINHPPFTDDDVRFKLICNLYSYHPNDTPLEQNRNDLKLYYNRVLLTPQWDAAEVNYQCNRAAAAAAEYYAQQQDDDWFSFLAPIVIGIVIGIATGGLTIPMDLATAAMTSEGFVAAGFGTLAESSITYLGVNAAGAGIYGLQTGITGIGLLGVGGAAAAVIAGQPSTQIITPISNPAVSCDSFTANPNSIKSGESSALSWNCHNATFCSINSNEDGNAVGSVSPVTVGAKTVSPTRLSTYALTCSNSTGGGYSTSTAVFVTSQPDCTFNVSPSSITQDQSTLLVWGCQNAGSCSIDNGIGAVPVTSMQGNSSNKPLFKNTGKYTDFSVSPNATTQYTLTCASNQSGGTPKSWSDTVIVAPLVNNPPVGTYDGPEGNVPDSRCVASGWAYDPDGGNLPNNTMAVHIYADGPAGSASGKGIGSTITGGSRNDVCAAISGAPCNSGFTYALPSSFYDGLAHKIYAYAIDAQGEPNPLINGSPKTITCEATKPTVSWNPSSVSGPVGGKVSFSYSASPDAKSCSFWDENGKLLLANGPTSYNYPDWTIATSFGRKAICYNNGVESDPANFRLDAISPSAVFADVTFNGQHNISLNDNGMITLAWSSQNGTSYSARYNSVGANCVNKVADEKWDWVTDSNFTGGGAGPLSMGTVFSGCTITVTFAVSGSGGSAVSTAAVTMIPLGSAAPVVPATPITPSAPALPAAPAPTCQDPSANNRGGALPCTYDAPDCSSMRATPPAIVEGNFSVLSWNCTGGATNCSINNGVGNVGANSSRPVSPSSNTTYSISCDGPGGTTGGGSALVTVFPLPVCTFWATPQTIIPPQSSSLDWRCSNANTCSIDNGVGTVNAKIGPYSKPVSPAATTKYNLSCTGNGGASASFQTTLRVTDFNPKEIVP